VRLDQINTSVSKAFSDAETRTCSFIILEGMRLLADWSDRILRQSAWKYAHPNIGEKSGDPVSVEYERVVKHNYTSEERFVLVEAIACLKGLASMMMRHESLLSPIIRYYIHSDLQEFIQVPLPPPIPFLWKSDCRRSFSNHYETRSTSVR